MFTPVPSFLGGLLLSYSTSALLVSQGRVLGCSGVAHSSISSVFAWLTGSKLDKQITTDDKKKELGPAPASTSGWKVAALCGLISGGVLVRFLQPVIEGWTGSGLFDAPAAGGNGGVGRAVLAGLLVGVGTKLANGCTSGHMLLGLARLSRRSLAAVLTFFSTALITARLFPPLNSLPTSTALPAFFLTPTSSPYVALFLLAPLLLLSLPTRTSPLAKHPHLAALLQTFSSAALFSLGLSLAGMLRPSKVLSFFYLPLPYLSAAPGAWDPSLAMVALGGLVPNALVWQRVKGWKKPLRGERWEVPRGGKVDGKLLVGAALFGVGWGLSGICPGPLFANLGAGVGGLPIVLFAASFAVGGLAAGKVL